MGCDHKRPCSRCVKRGEPEKCFGILHIIYIVAQFYYLLFLFIYCFINFYFDLWLYIIRKKRVSKKNHIASSNPPATDNILLFHPPSTSILPLTRPLSFLFFEYESSSDALLSFTFLLLVLFYFILFYFFLDFVPQFLLTEPPAQFEQLSSYPDLEIFLDTLLTPPALLDTANFFGM